MPTEQLTAAQTGVIIVDHGSRVAASNQLLIEVVQKYAADCPFPVVEPAHMEIAEPSIETAFGKCVHRGAKFVVVFPYFLLPGRHVTDDIPRLAAEAAAKHPNVQYIVTHPFGLDEQMFEIMNERILSRLAQADG